MAVEIQDGKAMHAKEWGIYDLATGHGEDGGRKDGEVESSFMDWQERWNGLNECVLYGNEILPSTRLVLMVLSQWPDSATIFELRSCLLFVMRSSIPSFPKFLPSPRNLILRHIPMLSLPLMSMQCKTLTLWLRYPGKHAHFHNHHFRKDFRNAHNRTNPDISDQFPNALIVHFTATGNNETKALTSHTRHKNTVPHTSRSPFPYPCTSSSFPLRPRLRLFLSQSPSWKIRRTPRLCGSWRSGIGGRVGV
jgi:hypothetical protein